MCMAFVKFYVSVFYVIASFVLEGIALFAFGLNPVPRDRRRALVVAITGEKKP